MRARGGPPTVAGWLARREPPRLPGVLAVALLLSLQACANMPRVVQLEEGDDNHAVTLKSGQLLEIRLRDAGRGTALSLGSVVEPVLTRVGKPTLHDDTIRAGVAGTGNYESWTFRGAQPGSVDVRMDYRLQWERTGPPSRSVTYHVTVQ